jgi:tetratricopeptide (TPR) repeat protein
LRPLSLLYSISLFWVLASCSSESNTWTSKTFHNTTAHYNGYFYAREEITKIEASITKAEPDNYNEILRLLPTIDSTRALGYDKEIQEAIKMASLAIQRHPNSKWVDDSYILVGKARLYSRDWGNAIQTFKYINTKSKDHNVRHAAIVLLARTFIEHQEFNNAEAAFDFLSKQKLNKTNLKNYLLTKAYYYQLREDYDNMVRNLTQAAPLLKRKDRAGRVYFIIAQVYQQIGFEAEAFNFYKKCIATNPDYETDFYARLYMAQVAEISRSRDIASARKSFKKLLKDSKNKDFRDKIYYEMGVFERKQKNISEAIPNYNLAIKLGANKQIDGEAYLDLGEIYYDSLRNYELSKAYYDSAVAALPTTHDNYKAIVARQKILDEFVTTLNIIKWQDSLLVMAKMDTATLRKHIKTTLDKQNKPETTAKKKKRERIDITTVSTSANPSAIEGASWYFGNPSAVSIGQTEFARVWGNIPLEDNWRRSSRTSTVSRAQAASKQGKPTTPTEKPVVVKKSPEQEALERITSELPKSEKDIQNAHKKIEDAYFRLGDLYYFDLHENDNAVTSYQTLLKRYPESTYEPEILYKLYLIFKDIDHNKATQYSSVLIKKYPDSDFAKSIVNPNYLKESGIALEKQKQLYKSAYAAYDVDQYAEATALLNDAVALGKTPFTPNLELLQIIIKGKTESLSQYQTALQSFIKTYPNSELKPYAQKLLDTSKDFVSNQNNSQAYNKSFEQPHFFVLAWKFGDNLNIEVATKTLQNFNDTFFKEHGLSLSNLTLNETCSVILVGDLPRISTSLEYYKAFIEKQSTFSGLKNYKFYTFIITKDNFDIFYRTKGLDEYLRFFEKNYRPENP